MSYLLTVIITLIAGGFVALIITIIFEPHVRHRYQRIRRRWFQINQIFKTEDTMSTNEDFHIGNWSTNCRVLEGTSSHSYLHKDISCHLDTKKQSLPPELQELKKLVVAQQHEIEKKKGIPDFYDGPMTALEKYEIGRTKGKEDPKLSLSFKLSDYYSFLATSQSLERSLDDVIGAHVTVREKFLSDPDFREPVPFLATSFGVNLPLVTKDKFLIFIKRGGRGISNYRGRYSVMCESVHPDKDINSTGQLDLTKTAIRGFNEEFGLDIEKDEIDFYSLVVDTDLYLYGLTGCVYTEKITRDGLFSRRSSGLKDKWESKTFEFVGFDPRAVAAKLRTIGGTRNLHPASFVAIVQALKREYGQSPVEDAFEEFSDP